MKTLIIMEGNCGDEGQQYKKWLEKNLPDDINLDFRDGCSGVGGGMVNADEILEGESNEWWNAYCNS